MSTTDSDKVQCKRCDEKFKNEAQLNTHVLLKHPDLARSNSDEYRAEVSDGHLDEREIEKGEQFGYR